MGLSYRRVDQLLSAMIDQQRDRNALLAMGFEEEFIERVSTMIRANEFKRRPPMIAKISETAGTSDVRRPREPGR
jgi:NAD+ synthase